MATPNIYADQIEWMQPQSWSGARHHQFRCTRIMIAARLSAAATRGDGRSGPRRRLSVRQWRRTGNVTSSLGASIFIRRRHPGLDFSQIKSGARGRILYALPIHPRTLTWRSGVHRFSGLASDANQKRMLRARK